MRSILEISPKVIETETCHDLFSFIKAERVQTASNPKEIRCRKTMTFVQSIFLNLKPCVVNFSKAQVVFLTQAFESKKVLCLSLTPAPSKFKSFSKYSVLLLERSKHTKKKRDKNVPTKQRSKIEHDRADGHKLFASAEGTTETIKTHDVVVLIRFDWSHAQTSQNSLRTCTQDSFFYIESALAYPQLLLRFCWYIETGVTGKHLHQLNFYGV